MNLFKLVSEFQPKGDQPQAIRSTTKGSALDTGQIGQVIEKYFFHSGS